MSAVERAVIIGRLAATMSTAALYSLQFICMLPNQKLQLRYSYQQRKLPHKLQGHLQRQCSERTGRTKSKLFLTEFPVLTRGSVIAKNHCPIFFNAA